MKDAWKSEWHGERVYIEVETAGIVESWVKAASLGMLGRAKTHAILLYGRQVVARRIVKEAIGGIDPEFDLVGTGVQPDDKCEVIFHATITPRFASTKCKLTINGRDVEVAETAPDAT